MCYCDDKTRSDRAIAILDTLRQATKGMLEPMSQRLMEEFGKDPFVALMSCLLSLRARDTMTYEISRKLFSRIRTPEELVAMPGAELEELIRPIGFYRRKGAILREVATQLIKEHGGVVPKTEEGLRALKHVGPKTAALVLPECYDIPAICVDVHVHRISNRLGIVRTKTPEQTEAALKKLLPPSRWREVNRLLVMWGQNVCTPVSPKCSECPVFALCDRVGVVKNR